MPSDRLDDPVLVLVCGLPGSGKTTHAREVEGRLSAVRLSADDWLEELAFDLWDEDARDRIEQLQWQLAKRLVAVGVSVVIEWGTWSRAERDHIRIEAQRLGARTELHHLAAPSDVLYERVVRRGREEPAITRQQVEEWEAAFEIPSPDETERWDHFEPIDTGTDRR
jgi:predicted kinase